MKKVFRIFVLVTAIGILSAFALNTGKEKIRVVIDAGHGGDDVGALNLHAQEKEISLAIANKIKALNTNENIELLFTREEDKLVSLSERVEKINALKPDLVLSLHINNSKNISAEGMEAFVPKDLKHTAKSEELATKLLEILGNKTDLKSRGVKTAPFYILKKSEYPSIIVELGFMSNPSDRAIITSDDHQNKVAAAVLDFISKIK